MDFHHFIITRFNVNIYPLAFPKRLEDTWLALRFELFQRYCFPTVRAQQLQNFTWLVLFDEQTPARYRKVIQAYARYGNFTPHYCGAYETIMPSVIGRMQELAHGAEWFLTTRLDNDDALSIRFTRGLHKVVAGLDEASLKPSDTLFLNFPNGLQYCSGTFYAFRDETNAFVSLLERREDPRTVFWVDHPSIHEVSRVVQVEAQPLWLQVVHDLNVYNYVRGTAMDGAGLWPYFPCDFGQGADSA